MDTLEQITEKINGLQARADELLEQAKAEPSKVAEVKALITDEIQPQLEVLTKDREIAVQQHEIENLSGTVTTLKDAIESLREPSEGIVVGTPSDPEGKGLDADNPYADGKHSPFVDIRAANKGVPEARERLTAAAKALGLELSEEGKALTEGTGAQGGYLVQPQIERQIVLAREQDNVLRRLCSVLNVNTNAIQLDQIGYSTTAGWVAELATKPETTNFTLASITASVFTAAGLATISNQLLQDANPAVDQLATSDLTKRLVALEETAFISGSGTNQPLGILNTAGIGTTASPTAGDPAVAGGLLDNILDSIAAVQGSHGQPTAIVMHPRTWTRILKSRDAAGHYTVSPSPIFGQGYDAQTPRTVYSFPAISLFGVTVVLSNRVPTNLGAGTNESRVIVGDFREALILDRQGITVDESPHVFFTSNQTVFRAETRVGFTAARTPLAFNVIGGVGLANG